MEIKAIPFVQEIILVFKRDLPYIEKAMGVLIHGEWVRG